MAHYVEQEKGRELSRAEENLHQLEQCAETLKKHREQTEALLKKQDDVQFLQVIWGHLGLLAYEEEGKRNTVFLRRFCTVLFLFIYRRGG